jgi:hypothetical protein
MMAACPFASADEYERPKITQDYFVVVLQGSVQVSAYHGQTGSGGRGSADVSSV